MLEHLGSPARPPDPRVRWGGGRVSRFYMLESAGLPVACITATAEAEMSMSVYVTGRGAIGNFPKDYYSYLDRAVPGVPRSRTQAFPPPRRAPVAVVE